LYFTPMIAKDRLKDVFRRHDDSGKGVMGRAVLERVLESLDPKLSPARMKPLIDTCFLTPDGALRYEEFLDGIFGAIGDGEALRERLVSFGNTCSIEVSPDDVAFVSTPKKQSLMDLITDQTSPMQQGSLVFINMVKPNMEHFEQVIAASSAISAAGFVPVPHLPVSRLESESGFRSTLSSLAGTGANRVLVLGGNDLGDRVEANSCAYSGGAGALLASELPFFRTVGVTEIGIAGHPDGHPAVAGSAGETQKILIDKVRQVFAAGLDVIIVTQFCFDARKLIRWLKRTREETSKVVEEVAHLNGRRTCRFRIGVHGPTSRKKLTRIAGICEVPSLFLSSAFDMFDADMDGLVNLAELQDLSEPLGLGERRSSLNALYEKHAGADKLLSRDEFSQLLVEDAMLDRTRSCRTSKEPVVRIAHPTAQGPSTCVSGSGTAAPVESGQGSDIVWPEETVLALAAFCNHVQAPEGEIGLSFYPFGGLSKTFELASTLQRGTWPQLTESQ